MAKHNEEAVNGKSDPINSNKSKQNQTKPEHLEKKLSKTRASTNLTHVGSQVVSCPFIVPLVNVRWSMYSSSAASYDWRNLETRDIWKVEVRLLDKYQSRSQAFLFQKTMILQKDCAGNEFNLIARTSYTRQLKVRHPIPDIRGVWGIRRNFCGRDCHFWHGIRLVGTFNGYRDSP